jgi:hypothetical protein
MTDILMDKGIKSVALTYTNNDYGKGLADSFQAAFEAAGGTVTSSAAHEIVQDLVVTRMRAQAEVLKLNGELVSAAKKKDALNAYMAHGMDLSKKLSQRLIETMDILAALDWDSFDAAEAEAQMKTVEIERRKAAGEMNAAWAERALLRVEQVRDSKTAFANRIVGRFLEQLDEQVSMTLNTVQRDSDRYANFL